MLSIGISGFVGQLINVDIWLFEFVTQFVDSAEDFSADFASGVEGRVVGILWILVEAEAVSVLFVSVLITSVIKLVLVLTSIIY